MKCSKTLKWQTYHIYDKSVTIHIVHLHCLHYEQFFKENNILKCNYYVVKMNKAKEYEISFLQL